MVICAVTRACWAVHWSHCRAAPGDDVVYPIGQACAKGGGPSTIRVEKTGDRECRLGQPCSFDITITKDGTSPFSGPVRIGDAIGVEGLGRLDGVAITSIDPPFGCSPEPATLPASCIAITLPW